VAVQVKWGQYFVRIQVIAYSYERRRRSCWLFKSAANAAALRPPSEILRCRRQRLKELFGSGAK